MSQVVGYCIVNKETGELWGDLYRSKSGAKKSFNDWVRSYNRWREEKQKLFDEQDEYVLKHLVIADE